MKEILSPFISKQKFLQMLLCSFIFIGMAVPFKVMVLIDGFTEVRPVNAVPVVAGLLFGPAGAWGCAIGNLVSDLSGTFSKASVLGFVGNFIAAWLPYRLWHMNGKNEAPNVKTPAKLIKYVGICAMSALSTALLIACGLDVIFKLWMPKVFFIILINNLGFSVLLGLPVFIVLTTDDSNLRITLPAKPSASKYRKHFRINYIILSSLMASEAILLAAISLGKQTSNSLLLSMIFIIFIISLCFLAVVNWHYKPLYNS